MYSSGSQVQKIISPPPTPHLQCMVFSIIIIAADILYPVHIVFGLIFYSVTLKMNLAVLYIPMEPVKK